MTTKDPCPAQRIHQDLEVSYQEEVQRPFTDSLTGLFTHGFFQISLDQMIKRAQRYAVPFTLGLLDIDAFSLYNARYGALQGDQALQRIAAILKKSLRKTDLAVRYAGDIFAILLDSTEMENALAPADHIRRAIEHPPDLPLTVSLGLVAFPRDAATKAQLLQKAHHALQQAKIRGKNMVYSFKQDVLPADEEQPQVLIVDDDPRNLKLLNALLLPLNVAVIKATNAQEALHLLTKIDIDLILLDIMMPDIDGFETCRRIKTNEATRLIPVILVTALDDIESKLKGIEAGADDFITKPPNKLELHARTKTLIRLKKLNHNLTSIENVLFSLANTVEAKDENTQGHVERVGNIAMTLGKQMGLKGKAIEALKYGGMLHDIGKIGVPGKLLNKPGPLTREEECFMQRHTEIGYKICLPLKNVLGPALDVIRHHHEKLDGSGYPDGLKDGQISLVARIMAVVDIYDALIADRPYRQGLPQHKVFDILRQEARTGKLDRGVVENLIEMVR